MAGAQIRKSTHVWRGAGGAGTYTLPNVTAHAGYSAGDLIVIDAISADTYVSGVAASATTIGAGAVSFSINGANGAVTGVGWHGAYGLSGVIAQTATAAGAIGGSYTFAFPNGLPLMLTKGGSGTATALPMSPEIATAWTLVASASGYATGAPGTTFMVAYHLANSGEHA